MTQLRVLKQGTTGEDVQLWQRFLRAQKFVLAENGKFNDETVQGTVDFQRLYDLPPTGRVDNVTLGRAMVLGYKVLAEEPVSE
jgi:Putative peptidoglycan binding domain